MSTEHNRVAAGADDRDRLLEQEMLIMEATERLTELMALHDVSKAELARRLGRSRSYVTQLLESGRNMTMRTAADVAYVLGHRLRVGQEGLPSSAHADPEWRGRVIPVSFGNTYRRYSREHLAHSRVSTTRNARYGQDLPTAAETAGHYDTGSMLKAVAP